MSLLPFLLEAEYHYRFFYDPAPLWHFWYLLLLPLCLAIAIVYKSIRCPLMARVPREAAMLFVFILVVMALSGVALAGLVTVLR